MSTLHADYMVVGTGAMGMAFTDVMLQETNANILMVDKRHRPGGHWNDAYPYVRLHQPSAFYGVNSTKLGNDHIDTQGWNQGLYELASSGEVCAYFDQLMQQQFLPTGRVQYFPMCEYLGSEQGGQQFRSQVSGDEYQVDSSTKLVDATYMNVVVPAMRKPKYNVADGVRCIPPNELTKLHTPAQDYVVIGAGKTGMDACLWLLGNGVEPEAIRWVMPRDSWMLDRKNIQPGPEFADSFLGGVARQTEAVAQATSVEDLLAKMHDIGWLLRFDDQVEPTMYRCATVTTTELTQLQRIKQVIRLGKVVSLTATQIELEQGVVPTSSNTLHIDCTADGLARRPATPIFSDQGLTLQSVRTCQQVFSAAFIAHLEATNNNNAEKNALSHVVPHPDSQLDFLRCALINDLNGANWAADPALTAWLHSARLDGFSRDFAAQPPTAAEQGYMQRVGASAAQAMENLKRLLAS
jgi:hypothetical protein